MEKIIIYGSRYGSTRLYAEALAEKMDVKAVSYKDIKSISGYDTVIYMGGLYAGTVLGLSETVKKIERRTDGDNSHHLPTPRKIIVVTVGLADPEKPENAEHIKKSVEKQIPSEILDMLQIFCLQGKMDYKKLSIKHKIMMKFLYSMLKKIPTEKRSAEDEGMLSTRKQPVDFTDFEALNKIIDCIN